MTGFRHGGGTVFPAVFICWNRHPARGKNGRQTGFLQFPDSVERFVDPFHTDDGQPLKRLFGSIGFRNQGNRKAQFNGFPQTVLSSGCRADFSGQSDFTEYDQSTREWFVAKR